MTRERVGECTPLVGRSGGVTGPRARSHPCVRRGGRLADALDVARRAGFTRATARRVLHTLSDLGYVSTDGRRFSLRPKILELGHAFLSSMRLPAIVQPHLERAHRVGARVVVGRGARRARHRLRGPGRPAAHHDRLDQRRHPLPRLRARRWAGCCSRTCRPTSSTTTSTATSARRSRRTPSPIARAGRGAHQGPRPGWALSTRSWRRGSSIAAPIRDGTGVVVAAINLSASSRRGEAAEVVEHLLPMLLAAATAIDDDLRVIEVSH